MSDYVRDMFCFVILKGNKIIEVYCYLKYPNNIATNVQGFLLCCPKDSFGDIPCYVSLVLLLIKDRKLIAYSKAEPKIVSWDRHCERSEAELISGISMRIYSEASIAENPLLAVVISV